MKDLHPDHLSDLRKSGLTDETIEKSGIRSVPADLMPRRITEAFGHYDNRIVNAYEIPYFDHEGQVITRQLRIFPAVTFSDGSTVKYLNDKDRPATPYIPGEVWCVRQKTNKPLWITEGAKKALKLMQHGRHPIALNGVWCFGMKNEVGERVLFDDITAFVFEGRTVYLAFDADLWTNPSVRAALYELAVRLFAAGAAVKFVIWLMSEGKGIDDHILFHEGKGRIAEEVLTELESKARDLKGFLRPEHAPAVLRAISVVKIDDPVKFDQLSRMAARSLDLSQKTLRYAVCQAQAEKCIEAEPSEEERTRTIDLLKSPGLVEKFLATVS